MMNKKEYLAKAAARYDAIESLKNQKHFYSYEGLSLRRSGLTWAGRCWKAVSVRCPQTSEKKHHPDPVRSHPSSQTARLE
jgi:hypothetical protein